MMGVHEEEDEEMIKKGGLLLKDDLVMGVNEERLK